MLDNRIREILAQKTRSFRLATQGGKRKSKSGLEESMEKWAVHDDSAAKYWIGQLFVFYLEAVGLIVLRDFNLPKEVHPHNLLSAALLVKRCCQLRSVKQKASPSTGGEAFCI